MSVKAVVRKRASIVKENAPELKAEPEPSTSDNKPVVKTLNIRLKEDGSPDLDSMRASTRAAFETAAKGLPQAEATPESKGVSDATVLKMAETLANTVFQAGALALYFKTGSQEAARAMLLTEDDHLVIDRPLADVIKKYKPEVVFKYAEEIALLIAVASVGGAKYQAATGLLAQQVASTDTPKAAEEAKA